MKYRSLLIFSLLMSLALCLHAQNALTMKDLLYVHQCDGFT